MKLKLSVYCYYAEHFNSRTRGAAKMTAEQLTGMREALEAAHYALKHISRGAVLEEDLLNTIAKVEKALNNSTRYRQ